MCLLEDSKLSINFEKAKIEFALFLKNRNQEKQKILNVPVRERYCNSIEHPCNSIEYPGTYKRTYNFCNIHISCVTVFHNVRRFVLE